MKLTVRLKFSVPLRCIPSLNFESMKLDALAVELVGRQEPIEFRWHFPLQQVDISLLIDITANELQFKWIVRWSQSKSWKLQYSNVFIYSLIDPVVVLRVSELVSIVSWRTDNRYDIQYSITSFDTEVQTDSSPKSMNSAPLIIPPWSIKNESIA